jgi:acyl-CoA synthetase (AMP-forming)/AMP-acid ligase II
MAKSAGGPLSRAELGYRATVPAFLDDAVARFGDRDLVVTDVDRLTYREADRRSRALAKRLLAHGVGKGTRVATHFPFSTQWVVSWLAITRIGALHLPFSTAYKPAELRKALRYGDVALLLAPPTLFGEDHRSYVAQAVPGLDRAPTRPLYIPEVPYLRDVWFDTEADRPEVSDGLLAAVESQVHPADLAVAIFTSGTTSEPKGVLHSQGAMVRKGPQIGRLHGWVAGDRIFCASPLFWVGGLAMTLGPAFSVGAAILCIDKVEPVRALDLMEKEQATRLMGWTSYLGPIVGHPSAAGRDIPALKEPLQFAGARHTSLGMTETLACYTYSLPEHQTIPLPEGETGSVGWIMEGAEVRIADPETLEPLADGQQGAILVRGDFVLRGMIKREREEVFTADGFYNTGDSGFLLGDQLFIKGRLTEMIKTSGNNVAPLEVELVLRSLPGVKDAHVLGVPDDRRGEIVAALVIPVDGAHPDPDEIRERARTELSNFKVPRLIVLSDEHEVPILASGKPDRLRIRTMLAEAAANS